MLNNIPYKEALEVSLKESFLSTSKNVFINEALGYFLAEDVKAAKNNPSFDNSAMDGFGFKHSDKKKFKIIKTIYAGDKFDDFDIKNNECVKIMTGAKIPKGIDTVIPIENCLKVTGEYIEIPEIKKGANVRKKGEDIQKWEILIKKGEEITPETIALLASQGITNIKVYKKPSIAILSSGNELKEPYEKADEDEIYNINSYSIYSLLKKYSFNADIIGIVADTYEETLKEIKNILNFYDVIITSGGISFGEKDFMFNVFKTLGLKEFFHGIMVKPGRPTMIGKIGKKFIFAMPGNPLSSFLNMFCIGIPVLRKMSGADKYYHETYFAKNKNDFKVNSKKDHTALGFYENGEWEVYNSYKYGSGMLKPLLKSNSVAIIQKGNEIITKDTILKIIPFVNQFSNKNNMFN
ncbi:MULTISPECIES: molybdopterin molybdotransferase MoeA [unclassified Lebetimonas]|uniref:molybdopterin molybdotransferase MoeA n=1 Tax=unclassified Lebetimonas TaxID=2648158 RepID=UPI000462F09C|nr:MULTISPECIES: molybdopterin molybdotransferase MoeA [unclassified Lebetimonas]